MKKLKNPKKKTSIIFEFIDENDESFVDSIEIENQLIVINLFLFK